MADKDFSELAKDMMKNLQKQWDDTLAGRQEAFKELRENAVKNYEELKKKAGEGKDEAISKMKKVNEDMLAKMKSLQQNMKEKMNTEYNKLIPDQEAAEKNLEEYKKQIRSSFSNAVSDKDSSTYKDAMNKLDKFQGKTKEEFDKMHGDMVKDLDKVYDESIKTLKFD